MRKSEMKRWIVVCVFTILLPSFAWGQKDSTDTVSSYENRFIRPLVDVLQEIEQRFGVRLKFAPADIEGKMLTYADFRIRPYSLEETLQNVFSPTEFKFERQKKQVYRIRPYEYYRRTPADGEKLLAWLHGKYRSREEWEVRRSVLKSDFRRLLGIDPLLAKSVDSPRSFKGKERKYDGYTVQNFALETLPGLYVCGSIYAPTKRGRHSLIMMPVGHWADARYNSDMQYRFAALARAGAVCVSFDLVGWGESEMQLGKGSHNTALSQPLQCLWGVKILDWILADRKDIDMRRIGVCGGPGSLRCPPERRLHRPCRLLRISMVVVLVRAVWVRHVLPGAVVMPSWRQLSPRDLCSLFLMVGTGRPVCQHSNILFYKIFTVIMERNSKFAMLIFPMNGTNSLRPSGKPSMTFLSKFSVSTEIGAMKAG